MLLCGAITWDSITVTLLTHGTVLKNYNCRLDRSPTIPLNYGIDSLIASPLSITNVSEKKKLTGLEFVI